MPGARPYVINEGNANEIQARLIAPGANIPVTDEADEALMRRGVVVLPDFVTNSGGVIAATLDRMSATEEQAFKVVEERISSLIREVLSKALGEKRSRYRTQRLNPGLVHVKTGGSSFCFRQFKKRLPAS
ncbi:MAG: hypothetical protein QXZ06_06265 [Candidatus Jordarchaeales archaeon]